MILAGIYRKKAKPEKMTIGSMYINPARMPAVAFWILPHVKSHADCGKYNDETCHQQEEKFPLKGTFETRTATIITINKWTKLNRKTEDFCR